MSGALPNVVLVGTGGTIGSTGYTPLDLVKYLGAVYLCYLGLKHMFGGEAQVRPGGRHHRRGMHVFWEAALVNLLNPKTALFFVAFLPQFVDPARGGVAPQLILLGAVFIGLGILTDGAYAMAAARAGRWFSEKPRLASIRRFTVGGMFLALGVASVVSDPSDRRVPGQ